MEHSIPKTGKQSLLAACALILLTALDQLTKLLAAKSLISEPFTILPGIFRLQYLENRGAAFGILQNQRLFFIVLTAAFLLLLTMIWRKLPGNRRMLPLRILCILIAAGAAGNLIDRIALVYVRDFFYFELIDFPIFNVADIYVTVSAALLFFLILFYYRDEELEGLNPFRKTADTAVQQNASEPVVTGTDEAVSDASGEHDHV